MFLPESTLAEQQALVNQLDALLNTLEVPHKKDFDSMVAASQRWRRTPNQERWELPDIPIDQARHVQVISQLRDLGLIDEAIPSRKEFDYVLLLGATVPRMQRRLEQLVKLWQKGVRYQQLVFLVGQRELNPDIDQVEALVTQTVGYMVKPDSYPRTETEGAVMLFQSTGMMPDMKARPARFVDSPRKWNQTYWQRPNTRDTLKSWMAEKPVPGSVLVISDQPHGLYQLEVTRQELTDEFSIELTAQAADKNTRLAVYLDALALWLHNLKERLNQSRPVPAKGYSEIMAPPTRH